jgi:modulator of FtsH protease HflC
MLKLPPVVYVVVAVLLLVVLVQTVFVVHEGEQAIIIQLGQFRRAITEPGLNVKLPFLQEAVKLERRILSSDAEASEYLTLDRKRVIVNHVVRWRINDPLRFYITVRDEAGARARLDDLVFSELRRELASLDFGKLIAEEREPAMERIAKSVADRAVGFGIDVVDVRVKRADLPTEVQASVFARMVAERERIAKRYRSEGEEEGAKIRADADKERTIILARAYQESQLRRGEGDAEATAVYAAAFGKDADFYGFVRSLEAYEKFLGDDSLILMSPESTLLRFLDSARVPR